MSNHSSPKDLSWWQGAVESRARLWAEAVYARTKGTKPWPASGGEMMLQARRAIVDVLSLNADGDAMVKVAYEVAKAHYEKLLAHAQ